MSINAEMSDGILRLAAEGELTVPVAFELRDAIGANLSNIRRVEVDLSGVEMLGSACLQMLYLLWQEAIIREVEIELSSFSEAVDRVLTTCGLRSFFGLPSGSAT